MTTLKHCLICIGCFMTTGAFAQDVVITSFQGNGLLSWTNPVLSNAVYRVEWAAQAGGPWYRTFANIGSLDGLDAAGSAVSVPMFYRVVKVTNEAPVGMVWMDEGDAEIGQTNIATPAYTAHVSGIWVDATEVTKEKWDEVAGWAATNGYDISAADGTGSTNNHPVGNVTWYECAKWCNARSEKEGRVPCYYTDVFFFDVYRTGDIDLRNERVIWNSGGYRLPTEAEWEKAARGARKQKLFPWGDTIQHTRANYYASTNILSYDTSLTPTHHPNYIGNGYTSPVGSFPANGYGVHDTAGNVREWCWDWEAAYTATYKTDPRGPTNGVDRINRGGAWDTQAHLCRNANRSDNPPVTYDFSIGFRCVKAP